MLCVMRKTELLVTILEVYIIYMYISTDQNFTDKFFYVTSIYSVTTVVKI